MKNILGRFRSYLHETKELNRIYYEQEAFSDDIKEIQQDKERTSEIEKYGKERIAILLNSRIYRENLSKEVWLKNSQAVEEKMMFFRYLPFQVCNCSYIGEGIAWTGYNFNNKKILQIAINQINYFLGDLKALDETVPKIIPTDFYINFNSICFDGPYSYGLPRSYILYQPETKSGKRSQYPLIAFFNTAKGTERYIDEFYLGKLYYAINGDLSKATVHCHKHGKFAELIFSVVGRTFLISKINTLGQDRKPFTVYDCSWHFTDYADFS